MVFRGKVRGGVADAAFGRVRLLPVIAHGDSRARPPEPEMRGQTTGTSSPSGHRCRRQSRLGPAGAAEIQSDQMDSTLMPLPLVIEPVAACAIMFHSQ
jgi:hypothetical protein